MKTLSGGGLPESEKRPDMGDMPISNAKYNCAICKLKQVGCHYIVNTLNCEIAIRRMRKLLSEEKEDSEMADEQNKAVKNFLDTVKETNEEDDED